MSNQLTQEHIDHNTKLLIEASKQGDAAEVKRLILVSDPRFNNSEALREAAMFGRTDIVKLLIPVSDPKAGDNDALFWAVAMKNTDIVELLIPVSDYNFVLDLFQYHQDDKKILQQCINEYETLEALMQKERLTHELKSSSVNHTQHSSVKRKM